MLLLSSAEEIEALEKLSKDSSPMAQVVYHMSMRQLAMSERLADMCGAQARLVTALEKSYPSGSKPNLKAVLEPVR